MCSTLAEQLTAQVTISRKRKPGETATSPIFKKPSSANRPPTRVYSNNLSDSVKTFCCECDQVVNLSGLRKHLQRVHQQSIAQYRELYGDPATQIIQLVHHTCTICSQDLVLDYDVLLRHLRTVHRTSLAQYGDRHMTKEVGKRPSPMLMTSVTKESSFTKESLKLEKGTKITCIVRTRLS
jgi:hypothetical protein